MITVFDVDCLIWSFVLLCDAVVFLCQLVIACKKVKVQDLFTCSCREVCHLLKYARCELNVQCLCLFMNINYLFYTQVIIIQY